MFLGMWVWGKFGMEATAPALLPLLQKGRKMEKVDRAGKCILVLYTLSRLDKWNDSIREQENIDASSKIRFL